ncbi:15408_t:CDS:2 [Gigaspora rosea]|nr:15408_t:CDS:2 [Gigaspora rosea]
MPPPALIHTKIFATGETETGLLEQLRQIFSFKNSGVRILEEPWLNASVEWPIQRQNSNYESKEAYDTTAQNNKFISWK